jgi:hypothetical protein
MVEKSSYLSIIASKQAITGKMVPGAGFGTSELGPLRFLVMIIAYSHVRNPNIKSF